MRGEQHPDRHHQPDRHLHRRGDDAADERARRDACRAAGRCSCVSSSDERADERADKRADDRADDRHRHADERADHAADDRAPARAARAAVLLREPRRERELDHLRRSAPAIADDHDRARSPMEPGTSSE